jgi:hypothetical protein
VTRFVARTFLLLTILTAAMTYPQVRGLRDTVHDDGDPLLNAWALAWVAHQLPRAPARLFDGNIFYPERRTLAYSETLLVPAAIVAPLHWVGVGPLLVYNIVLLSGFIVSGVGVALLVRSLTGHGGAGVIAGIIFAFLPFRIDHYPHVQLQQTQFIPLAMWAFHTLLRTGRRRDGVLLGLCVAGQMLSCTYYGLFLIPYMAVVCGVLLGADAGRARRRMPALLLAVAVGVIAVIPAGRAYLGVRSVVGERGREEVVEGSATWRDYLGPPEANAVYGRVLHRFAESERRLFPGFVAVVLAAIALWPPLTPTRLAYFCGLLLAFDMSLGFNGITYGFLYAHVLPFRALRIPARMGMMVGFSLAVLAGFGVARIAGRLTSPAARGAVLTVLAALLLVEYASAPLRLQTLPVTPPEVYADLLHDRGDSPTATLFEFPASPLDDPTYMYFSTFHWQHLVNGYSGFFPPSYVDVVNAVRNFPDDESMRAIKAHGARYLTVHGERLFGDRYDQLVVALARRPELTLISRRPWHTADKHSEISLYRVSLDDAAR